MKLKVTGWELRVLDLALAYMKDFHREALIGEVELDALESVHDKVLKAKVG